MFWVLTVMVLVLLCLATVGACELIRWNLQRMVAVDPMAEPVEYAEAA